MIKVFKDSSIAATIIQITDEDLENFQTLVKRALSTWQNPPESMVRFQDKLLGQTAIMSPTYKQRQYQD